jgi:CubicO group peptidase (beta-lactamase class C family)
MAKAKSSRSADPTTSMRVPGWPYDRPEYTSLAAAVQGEASRWNVPGIAVGILVDGGVETTSTGFANLATRVPMTDDTISQIGSISKVFTATLAMILVEDGLLDLDTPVVTYLPELVLADETVRDTVTLQHLLSHTSGIEGDRFIDYGRGDDALARAIAEFESLRQWFVPGDLWSYSNAGFYLACRVIEAVSGKPFETVFRERLVEPLGLETCFFFTEEIIPHAHAVGHYLKKREDGPTVVPYYSLPRHVAGTGLVVTSTRELLRFAQLHMGNGKVGRTRLLSTKAAKAMQEPIAEAGDFYRHYGLGWCIHEFPEFRTISHGGATNGFRANLTAIPEKGFAIATLTNGEPGSRAIQEIEAWALQHYLELSRPLPEPVSLSAKKTEAFAGDYTRHDGRFTVSVAPHGLDFRMLSLDEETGEEEADRTFPLVAVGDRRFWVPDGPMKGAVIDFITYEGNGSTQEFVRLGGRLAERVAEPKPAKKGAGKAKGKKG